MNSLADIAPGELAETLSGWGEKPFHARQILQWLWQKGVVDYAAMTNLSLPLRQRLQRKLPVFNTAVLQRADAQDGVVKLLLGCCDGERIECVLIPDADRRTACLSTQAGCAMGCAFCASGLAGLRRDLSPGEILQQVLHLRQQAGQPITNVVFMGIGEPLANYDATVRAVRTLIDPAAGGLSARKVTVSTVGLPGAIRRLAGEDLPITLAISLHAPTDGLRAQLMPAASKYPIGEVLAAARQFFAARHREVTLEYILLAGVNDDDACADALAELAGSLRCNVNLIRYNPVPALSFDQPEESRVRAFAERLARRGVNAHIRRSRGQDAHAACGQLRLPARPG